MPASQYTFLKVVCILVSLSWTDDLHARFGDTMQVIEIVDELNVFYIYWNSCFDDTKKPHGGNLVAKQGSQATSLENLIVLPIACQVLQLILLYS